MSGEFFKQTYSDSVKYSVDVIGRRVIENDCFSSPLISLLGRDRLRDWFGFDDKTIDTLRGRATRRSRKYSDEEVERLYNEGCLKVWDVQRDIERFREARGNPALVLELVRDTLAEVRTLGEEYWYGENTSFHNKVVLHNGDVHIVAYDPRIHREETIEDALSREDLTISYQRFISRKKEQGRELGDLRYEKYLAYRDELELAGIEILKKECADLLSHGAASSKVIVWPSPPPPPSKYARELGYKVGWRESLSHWRSYELRLVDAHTVEIDAKTVFTYRPKWRLRRLTQQSIAGNGLHTERIRKTPFFPTDRDFLQYPFLSSFTSATESAEKADLELNKRKYWFDLLSYFSSSATKRHVATRLTQAERLKNIFDQLNQAEVWELLCLLVNDVNSVDPRILKEILIDLNKHGQELGVQHLSEEWGKDLSTKEREKLSVFLKQSIGERSKAGGCAALKSSRKVIRLNKDTGELEEVDEQEVKPVCKACKESFTAQQIKKVYNINSLAEKSVCPHCYTDVCGEKCDFEHGWVVDLFIAEKMKWQKFMGGNEKLRQQDMESSKDKVKEKLKNDVEEKKGGHADKNEKNTLPVGLRLRVVDMQTVVIETNLFGMRAWKEIPVGLYKQYASSVQIST